MMSIMPIPGRKLYNLIIKPASAEYLFIASSAVFSCSWKPPMISTLNASWPTFLISTSDVSSSDLYMMNDQNLSVPQP